MLPSTSGLGRNRAHVTLSPGSGRLAIAGAPPAANDQRIFIDGHVRVGGKTQLGRSGDWRQDRQPSRSVDQAGFGHVIIAAVNKVKEINVNPT